MDTQVNDRCDVEFVMVSCGYDVDTWQFTFVETKTSSLIMGVVLGTNLQNLI